MQRRSWIRFLAVAVVLAVAIAAGCAPAPAPAPAPAAPGPAAPAPAAPRERVSLSWTLGGLTGDYYLLGAALAEYVNRTSGFVRLVPAASGGGVENVRRVGLGEAEFGAASPVQFEEAWAGTGTFDRPFRDIRAVGPGIKATPFQFVTLARSNITSLNDLPGKRFIPGAPGSLAANSAERLLSALGTKAQVDVQYFGFTEMSTMLKDGIVDVIVRGGVAPAAQMLEINATHPIRLLNLKDVLDQTGFLQKYPAYVPYTIPAGTYNFQQEDVLTFAVPHLWIVHKDVADDVVYELTRLFYGPEGLQAADDSGRPHDHKIADPLTALGIPLHPGAEKYWKERGLTIPEPAFKP